MKIGVISDTHIPTRADQLPEAVFQHFKGVDLILHAGDIEDILVLYDLQEIAPVKAVAGNMDPYEVKEELPMKRIIKVGSVSIGLIHGWGDPKGLPLRVLEAFMGENVQCIVFGHSHQPFNEERQGILLFNPGSPTDKIFAPYNSIGILYIGKEIKGEIIKI
ncbi:metallophosphoesterase family protein [bacterium]|nr:metallophosphoesterase family protein [bacterium]